MNKNRFKQVVKEFHNLALEDKEKLHELVKAYPYSQIIHTLVAKANNDASTNIARQSLNYAAMYTTDRAVLKSIIESKLAETRTPVSAPQTAVQEHHEPEVEGASLTKGTKVTVDEEALTNSTDDLARQVWADLEALKESKASYLKSTDIKETEATKAPVRKKTTTTKKSATTTKAAQTTSTSKSVKKPTIAAKKATTKSKATTKQKSPAAEKTRPVTPKKTKTTTSTRSKPKARAASESTTSKTTSGKGTSSASSKTTRTKKTTASDSSSAIPKKKTIRQKSRKSEVRTQQEIIEKFIDKEPNISSKKVADDNAKQEDLSKQSTSFGEDLISENLAQILIGQGKNKKAIDIYKKLIWKFPQKKSYFAALIEDLQK
ncbi:hypothetical protein FNH22_29665 [Fulvivirga sp. M361]|uniref:hypothetical protein n=1 Tax=Fulvivirga sp. M361 TaxID=2594266 RepID=UPI00117BC4E8|nr:hypothetical protein [Fulvivirga sp. M361]TRX48130.1 hypothetical protein FNH22_29665 [Fulvivirga sp. M361]